MRHDTKCYVENKYTTEQKRNINSGSNTEQIANYLAKRKWRGVGARTLHMNWCACVCEVTRITGTLFAMCGGVVVT